MTHASVPAPADFVVEYSGHCSILLGSGGSGGGGGSSAPSTPGTNGQTLVASGGVASGNPRPVPPAIPVWLSTDEHQWRELQARRGAYFAYHTDKLLEVLAPLQTEGPHQLAENMRKNSRAIMDALTHFSG